MCNYKHLSLSDRFTIEQELGKSSSFKAIARLLSKDCNTISREVRNHYKVKTTGSYGKVFNNCVHREQCTVTALCDDCHQSKNRHCKNCTKCHLHCSNYQPYHCPKLLKPPYVCNGCKDRFHCSIEKHLYDGAFAYQEYTETLKDSRSGVVVDQQELDHLNELLVPLIKKQHQSIHQAIVNNQNRIMHSEKTIYKFIDLGLLEVRNFDLPRKVRFRNRKKTTTTYKVDKKCLEGRTYEDYLFFLEEHPDIPIVQMDSVEGRKGGKVLLTIHFVNCSLMLAFIRDHNDAQSVIDIFEDLYQVLGKVLFSQLFPVILTDNGSEFSNPIAIELDPTTAELRTKIFYCHPSSPFEKGSCEVNHELLRRVLSKGTSFDDLTQKDINLMMSHINSYKRRKLNDVSPFTLFSTLYGKNILELLGIQQIDPNLVSLSKDLFKK